MAGMRRLPVYSSALFLFFTAGTGSARADALIYGSAADVEAFHEAVRDCECAPPFAKVWQGAVDTKAEVRLYVVRDFERHVRTKSVDSRNVVFVDMLDAMRTGENVHLMDLSDLDAFPAALDCVPDSGTAAAPVVLPDPPWASTRCSILLHVISEARHMAEGAAYEDAHRRAIEDENALRKHLGQTVRILKRISGPEQLAEDIRWSGSTIVISYPHITLFEGSRSETFPVDEKGRVILPPRFEGPPGP
jgi:hypothetical protein